MSRTTLTKQQNNRIEKLASPDNFTVIIKADKKLLKQLSPEEIARLDKKFLLVENMAAELAARMVKGTIKYSHDDNTLHEWYNYMMDDALDTINYLALMKIEVNKIPLSIIDKLSKK